MLVVLLPAAGVSPPHAAKRASVQAGLVSPAYLSPSESAACRGPRAAAAVVVVSRLPWPGLLAWATRSQRREADRTALSALYLSRQSASPYGSAHCSPRAVFE